MTQIEKTSKITENSLDDDDDEDDDEDSDKKTMKGHKKVSPRNDKSKVTRESEEQRSRIKRLQQELATHKKSESVNRQADKRHRSSIDQNNPGEYGHTGRPSPVNQVIHNSRVQSRPIADTYKIKL